MMRCVACLALLTGFACYSGCRKEDVSTIRVNPVSFDFGVVAASGQELSAIIDLHNSGSNEAKIELEATCGCISSENMLSLKAGESREVPFTFSTSGKTGEFRAEIGVICNGNVQKVPIKIVFAQEVHAFPSRVVLIAGSDGKLSGEFRLEANEFLMSNLRLDVDDDEVTLEKIELEENDRPERLQTMYRVVAADPYKRIFAPIRVRKGDQEWPVLNIPVISAAPYSQ
jgi:hypothetical protein